MKYNSGSTAVSLPYLPYHHRDGAMWHGFGTRVKPGLTPKEMLIVAGLDWSVEKQDIFLANNTKLNQKALVCEKDSSVLSIVGEEWNPVQNIEALEFFNDFALSGGMKMSSIGSLKDGKIVWALAKINESFKLFGVDQVDGYLLFSNPHQFGKCIDVKFVATRAISNTTLTYALDEKVKSLVKLYHFNKFKGDAIIETLDFAKECLNNFHEQAIILSSKRYTQESLTEYFAKVFPITTGKAFKGVNREISNNAIKALEIIHTQPGANYAEGTFWQAFNTVTYMVDHVTGTNEHRLYSAWYGQGEAKKRVGLFKALEMAKVV